MMKLRIIPVLLLVSLIAACTSDRSVNSIYSTHVKDMVQADVFEVLPQYADDVIVYYSPDEIAGEYLELASVEMEEINSLDQKEEIMDRLLKEAKALGSNGVLLLSKETSEKDGTVTQELKAVAVYELDRAPVLNPLIKT